MKILWLVNVIMPELAGYLGEKPTVFGGWLVGAMNAVRESGNDMVICTVDESDKCVEKYEVNGATYYVIQNSNESSIKKSFSEILNKENPDIIHVYGTEKECILQFLQVADLEKTVLTLQGTMQFTNYEAYAGIPECVCKDTLLHKFRRKLDKGGDSVGQMKEHYEKNAVIEEKIIKLLKYADGCSDYGIAYIRAMNPECRMFNCGCILRSNSYESDCWKYEKCDKHSAFALMTRPVKGAHKLIEAMPYVLKQYPDAKLYLGGTYFSYRNYIGIKGKIQDITPDYNWYIEKLIDDLELRDNIVFLGYLDAVQIKEQLLKANVFVSPSATEHLATALGEAMITGTPSISTSVGALCEMIDHREDGFLYDFSEIHILAQYICDIFGDIELAEKFSKNGRAHAQKTYDVKRNASALIEMYEEIYSKSKETI